MFFPAFSFHEVIELSFVAILPVDCHYLLYEDGTKLNVVTWLF